MFIVLLGPPGVGKGTQAERLSVELGLPHVSSGELFREAMQNQTALGRQAKSYIDSGELVPDEVTIGMVAERLSRSDCSKGAVLDGFPRTIQQAEALDRVLSELGSRVALVLDIEASTDILLRRLGGRWTCKNCQIVYHEVFSPPREAGKCDACGGELYQRPDDTPETHRRRIEVYLAQTAPLREYYALRGLVVEIDGEQDIAAVFADSMRVIQQTREQLSFAADCCGGASCAGCCSADELQGE